MKIPELRRVYRSLGEIYVTLGHIVAACAACEFFNDG
jgi:hypothetical protein